MALPTQGPTKYIPPVSAVTPRYICIGWPYVGDRLLVVNPASSFERSVWPVIGPLLPNIPGDLYQALPYAIAPVLMDPNRLVAGVIATTAAATAAGGQGGDAVGPAR